MSVDSTSGAEAVEQPTRVEQPPPPPPDQPGAPGTPSRAESRAAAQETAPPSEAAEQPGNDATDASPITDELETEADSRSDEPAATPEAPAMGGNGSLEKADSDDSSPRETGVQATSADDARSAEQEEASRTANAPRPPTADQADLSGPSATEASETKTEDQSALPERRSTGLVFEPQAEQTKQQLDDEPLPASNVPESAGQPGFYETRETTNPLAASDNATAEVPDAAAKDGDQGRTAQNSTQPDQAQPVRDEEATDSQPYSAEVPREQPAPVESPSAEEQSPPDEPGNDARVLSERDTADSDTSAPEGGDEGTIRQAERDAPVNVDSDTAVAAISDGHRFSGRLTVSGVDVREHIDSMLRSGGPDRIGDDVPDPTDRTGDRIAEDPDTDSERRRKKFHKIGADAADAAGKTTNQIQDILRPPPTGHPETSTAPEIVPVEQHGHGIGDGLTGVFVAGVMSAELVRRLRDKFKRIGDL